MEINLKIWIYRTGGWDSKLF